MKRAALFVGIDNYESPEINSLLCAEKDADDLHSFFQSLLGYEDARCLLSPNIDEIVVEVESIMNSLSAGDMFLFYFSGHGVEFNGKHLLLDSEAKRQMLPFNYHALAVEMLKEITSGYGIDRVLILDCCRNNLFRSRGTQDGFEKTETWRRIASATECSAGSLTILCACDEGQIASEIDGQGLFTAAFLKCLRSAHLSGDGVALNDDLRLKLSECMEKEARKHGVYGAQRPWIQSSGDVKFILGERSGNVLTVDDVESINPISLGVGEENDGGMDTMRFLELYARAKTLVSTKMGDDLEAGDLITLYFIIEKLEESMKDERLDDMEMYIDQAEALLQKAQEAEETSQDIEVGSSKDIIAGMVSGDVSDEGLDDIEETIQTAVRLTKLKQQVDKLNLDTTGVTSKKRTLAKVLMLGMQEAMNNSEFDKAEGYVSSLGDLLGYD